MDYTDARLSEGEYSTPGVGVFLKMLSGQAEESRRKHPHKSRGSLKRGGLGEGVMKSTLSTFLQGPGTSSQVSKGGKRPLMRKRGLTFESRVKGKQGSVSRDKGGGIWGKGQNSRFLKKR